MSRIPVWCEIVCRTCANTTPGEFAYGAIPKRSLVKRARGKGWTFKYDEAFCSPSCVNQFENEQRAENG